MMYSPLPNRVEREIKDTNYRREVLVMGYFTDHFLKGFVTISISMKLSVH